MKMNSERLINDQIEYYCNRANEYDQWFLRQGRYYRGEEHLKKWRKELAEIKSSILAESPHGKALELACGTGLWTNLIAENADSLLAVDSSDEALEMNRRKNIGLPIKYLEADIFSLNTNQKFDFIFFGFWLSHVPEDRFKIFWHFIFDVLAPGGKVYFVDSLYNQDSTAVDHAPIGKEGIVERKLNNGKTYNIVKIFHTPAHLQKRLSRLGFKGWIKSTDNFFYYGCFSNQQ